MSDAFAHCEELVRAGDKDRFLATLFAPAERRDALFAIYAFNVEIARVREAVREPLAGAIRLQWWSDVLGGERRGEVAANPVSAALMTTIARWQLPVARLEALVEARRFDLYDEPMRTMGELEAYAEGASTNLIALAAQILCAPLQPAHDELAHHAGLAYGIAGLLKAFPIHAARGQLYIPLEVLQRHGADRQTATGRKDAPGLRAALAELRLCARRHLDRARALLPAAPPAIAPALLPVALVRPLLARMEGPGYDPFAPIEIAQWRRQWLIWRAAQRFHRIFA